MAGGAALIVLGVVGLLGRRREHASETLLVTVALLYAWSFPIILKGIAVFRRSGVFRYRCCAPGRTAPRDRRRLLLKQVRVKPHPPVDPKLLGNQGRAAQPQSDA